LPEDFLIVPGKQVSPFRLINFVEVSTKSHGLI
jgi:hypothetical protein